MVNQQLLDYIRQQTQQGINNEQIKQSLLANGWQASDIDEAFGQQQMPIQPKKRKWKKIVLIIIGVIVLLIIGLLSLPRFLNLFAKDIAPINDSDLQLQKVLVANSDNAYFDLTKLSGVIYEPKDKSQTILDMVAGKTWDNQVAEDIVSKNSQAFAYFAEAARKPKYQNPESADPANITPNMVLTPMNSWRQMTRLSAIHAIYLAKQGKDKEALDEALNSVSIGQKIQDSQATLIEYLVAIAMKGVGLETVQKIIPSSKLTSAELKQYAQGLDKFYKNENGLIMAFKGEYHVQSWAIDSIVSGDTEALKSVVGGEESQNPEIAKKIKDNYYFQPNKTKLLFAEYARVNIESANQSCGEIKATEVKPLAPTNPAKLYTEENAIGKILHGVIAVSSTGVSTKKCQEDLLVGATQVMIAIKAFKNDTNNYPRSLNELVPNYLSSVPQDPFDGKSLKYSVTKKILYSVGEDMQDSGGSTGDDWRKMADPTFVLNF
jgi:hypothetical protein